jgi:hypothetical protein
MSGALNQNRRRRSASRWTRWRDCGGTLPASPEDNLGKLWVRMPALIQAEPKTL